MRPSESRRKKTRINTKNARQDGWDRNSRNPEKKLNKTKMHNEADFKKIEQNYEIMKLELCVKYNIN